MESMNAGIKTDAEVITELVEHFRSLSDAQEDVTAILEQLEYYLHQVSNIKNKNKNWCSLCHTHRRMSQPSGENSTV